MILSIESSCDESSIALFDPNKGVVDGLIETQVDLHSEFGGVVPELASREHLTNFPKMMKEMRLWKLKDKLSCVSVTRGPGLAGCLAVGGIVAKTIGKNFDIPVIGVNHLRGHAWSPFINLHNEEPISFENKLNDLLPHLGLLVSGGNTLLFEINKEKKFSLLAGTVDDAAGEAIDKGGKLLGLDYPAGAIIEEIAKQGDSKMYQFPKAMNRKFDKRLSFSGLKTSLRYKLEDLKSRNIPFDLPSICASYQASIFDQIISKTKYCFENSNYKSFGLSGGVANNMSLRSQLSVLAKNYDVNPYIAEPKHCGDNAEMIAFASFVDSPNCFLDSISNPLRVEPSLSLFS